MPLMKPDPRVPPRGSVYLPFFWFRAHHRPLFWSLLSLSLFIITTVVGSPAVWRGMFLAVPLLIATVGWGWRAAAVLVPFGMLIVWITHFFSGLMEPAWFYVGLGSTAILSLVSGQSLYRLWWESDQQVKAYARRAKLLSQAVMYLHQAKTEQDIFEALPRLLASILPFTHAGVLVPEKDHLRLVTHHQWRGPEDFEMPLNSISGRALRTKKWQYVPDVERDPEYIALIDTVKIRSELAIPLVVDGEVRAVLNIEDTRVSAFSREDQQTLTVFTKIAEESILRTRTLAKLERRAMERDFIAELSYALMGMENAAQVAKHTLRALKEKLTVEAGVIFVLRGSHFVPLAVTGTVPDRVRGMFLEGIPWERGLTYRSWQNRQALFIDHYATSPHVDPEYRDLGIQSVAFVPVLTPQQEPQAILELISFNVARRWTVQEQRFLQGITATLGLALERAQASEQLREMLAVIRQLAQAEDPSVLYQRVVEAAVRLIPDSDAASLVVQQPQGYVFQGSYGYDLAQLERVPPIPEALQLHWYGGSMADFRAGVPRILRDSEAIAERSMGAGGQNDPQQNLQSAGKVAEIQSNLCVPITYHDDVLGLLNIDSLTREDAFGESALKLAEAFAQQLAVIIRQAQYRKALERSVVTDTLTGLGNRAGFNMQLQSELLTAKRYGQALSLIVMDLNGFKAINDTLGHQAGDEALVAVARALESKRRQADSLFRWGGDEFALILPQTDQAGAQVAAERYVEAVDNVRVQHMALRASIGFASYPVDGDDSDTLLKRADELMYQHKVSR